MCFSKSSVKVAFAIPAVALMKTATQGVVASVIFVFDIVIKACGGIVKAEGWSNEVLLVLLNLV